MKAEVGLRSVERVEWLDVENRNITTKIKFQFTNITEISFMKGSGRQSTISDKFISKMKVNVRFR